MLLEPLSHFEQCEAVHPTQVSRKEFDIDGGEGDLVTCFVEARRALDSPDRDF